MKLASTTEAVTAIGGVETGAFSIEMNEFMAELLSKKLYTDTVAAPIRELVANAYDIMRQVGNTDGFIDVHVPTIYEPHFSVRDYGTGLSHEFVMTNYNKYGKSEKRDSDDQIGGMGVGSKSPMAYDGNGGTYTVTSYYQGNKSTYVCYKDVGFPKVTHMHTEPSDEPSGLLVSFDVDSKDIKEFRDKIAKICQWFSNPSVRFSVELELPKPGVVYENQHGRACLKNNATKAAIGEGRYTALVGSIAYAVKQFPTMDAIVNTEYAHDYQYILNFDISEVDIAASREELLYSDRVQKILVERLRAMVDEHRADARKLIDLPISVAEKTRRFKSSGYTCFHRNSLLPEAFDFIKIVVERDLLSTKDLDPVVDREEIKAKTNLKSQIYNRVLKMVDFDDDEGAFWGDYIDGNPSAKQIKPGAANVTTASTIFHVNEKYNRVDTNNLYPCIVVNDDPKARPGRVLPLFEKHSVVYLIPAEMLKSEAISFSIVPDDMPSIIGGEFKTVDEFRQWCLGVDVYEMSKLSVHPSETPPVERKPKKTKNTKPAPTLECYSVNTGRVEPVLLSEINSKDSHVLVVAASEKEYIIQEHDAFFKVKNLKRVDSNNISVGWVSQSDFALSIVGDEIARFAKISPLKNVYVVNKSGWARFRSKQVAKDFIPEFMKWLQEDKQWCLQANLLEKLTDGSSDTKSQTFYKAELAKEFPLIHAARHGTHRSFWWRVIRDGILTSKDTETWVDEQKKRLKSKLDSMPLMKYSHEMNDSCIRELIDLYEIREKYLELTAETNNLKEAA